MSHEPVTSPVAVQPGEGASRADLVRRYFAAITAGDHAALHELLSPSVVTRWPQSGETITGADACIRVYDNYPGGPPAVEIERVVGSGDVWVAELKAQYGSEPWFITSVFEFKGDQIVRILDSFGPTFPAPEWRRDLVDPSEPVS